MGGLGATVVADSPSERHLWYFLSLSSPEAEQEGLDVAHLTDVAVSLVSAALPPSVDVIATHGPSV